MGDLEAGAEGVGVTRGIRVAVSVVVVAGAATTTALAIARGLARRPSHPSLVSSAGGPLFHLALAPGGAPTERCIAITAKNGRRPDSS